MAFAKSVWKLLVGIKDGLVLVFMLLFFFALYGILTARPSPAQVQAGALLLDLDGHIVEEKSRIDPFAALLSGAVPATEFDVQELVGAIDAAADDERIKAVVLDLTTFTGGGQVHMQDVGAALDRVRAAKKPVLTYAMAYTDDSMMLAAHASEVWVDPLGGAVIAGPGGSNLYFGQLLENLEVNAHVFKVGTYKSAVEPYIRDSMSEPARENAQALLGALWEEWQANVKKARPKLDLARVTQDPVSLVEASGGDLATAAMRAGMVDRIGNRVAFGEHVAQLVGEDPYSSLPGAFAHTEYEPWLADNPAPVAGKAIGVITIAGTIVDGDAGPGSAGGERIARLLDEALDDDLAGLIVRVDSPGGSVTASEEIRAAIQRYRDKGTPVAVSMANLAASGGYWVSTSSDRIFAEPETITGSIGIFAVLPTFERLAAKYGVNSDGVRTTPLSGQPDLIGGLTPEVERLLQATINNGYNDFLTRVAQSRSMAPAAVDKIAQGRVWDGGTARQIGLVDQFGGLPDAAAWVAGKAGIAQGNDYHLVFLGDAETPYDNLLRTLLLTQESDTAARGQDLFAMAAQRQEAALFQARDEAIRLIGYPGMQAYCLACPKPVAAPSGQALPGGWLAQVLARLD
ncbi:signal peptide peptidase SppA [Erythrobacter sp. LQ02-29]|uniref:signal peptide peptidase SppA n=1 Tax=Erythrobacter sp. LQ02-29 TaxID=2920384 RepID=UPI001F4D4347|nr:signal peptide peptidase SppA [Erythrobacter sp. LQ02-29]MCP9222406.1 signal peptide peptidase SppA [Erythrobacter sp. LQ02-29]